MSLFNKVQSLPYISSTGDKVYPIVVDIKKGILKSEQISFMTADNKVGFISIQLMEGANNYDIRGSSIVCDIVRPNATKLSIPCDIMSDNIIEVPLNINGTIIEGAHSFDIKITKNGKTVATPVMQYLVNKSIDSSGAVEEDDRIPILTTLITTVEDLVNRMETAINANTQDLEVKLARQGVDGFVHANLSDRLLNVDTQLDAKANDIEVRKKDILISEFDITDTLRQQINGNAPIIQGLSDKIVSPIKTTFFKNGKNLFNKNTVTVGKFVDSSNGNLVIDVNFNASDYIFIEGNSDYYKSMPHGIAFYDANKTYISGIGNTNSFTTPINCKYIRCSVHKTYLDSGQIEKGTVKTLFEEYKEIIGGKNIGILESDSIPKMPIDKMLFSSISTNLYNKNTCTLNAFINPANGLIASGEGFIASDFISVSNDSYIIKSARQYAFYDDAQTFVSGGNVSAPFNNCVLDIPVNCKYVRFSFYVNDGISNNLQQFNRGGSILEFEEFGSKIDDKYIRRSASDSCNINLPKTLYCVPDKQLRIRFGSVFTDYYKGVYDIKITCTKGKQSLIDWTYTPTSTETFPLTISIYKDNALLINKQITIKVVSQINTMKTLKGLFIGDSTTAHGYYPKNFKDICDNNSNINLSLIGTGTSLGVANEGRSGWTAKQYCTIASDSNYSNPFYNPASKTFDFNYYMTQQNYSSLDFVNIHLGINDVFSGMDSSEILNYINIIINSIKSYNANIKILLNITIPPNPNQNAWGVAYGCGKALWEYYRDYNNFLKLLINVHKDKEGQGIYLIGINAVLGDEDEYQDAVHGVYAENVGAYLKMAEQDYYAINSIFA